MISNISRVGHNILANSVTKLPINGFVQKYSTKREMKYEIRKPYKYHKLDKQLPTSITLTSEDALHLYKEMFILRRMETTASHMYKAKQIRGFCHLYSGQEAIAVGIFAVIRHKIDSIITSYRCHPFVYLTTGDIASMLAELAGRTNGSSRGKGGSMHVYGPNFYGGNGIVGAQVPLGTGIAFKNKYVGDGGVSFCMYGDGGANQGQIYEAMNMAVLWKLPCVFVCENNIYGMGTSVSRSSASTDYYTRGDYVPGLWADGMDVIACREAIRSCIDYACKKGPIVVEFDTYRYFGHSMSDPGTSYRSRDEVNKVRKTRDAITKFKDRIVAGGIVTEDQIKIFIKVPPDHFILPNNVWTNKYETSKSINNEVQSIVKKAEKEALTGPVPDPMEEIAKDVYSLCICEGGAIRGVLPTELIKHTSRK